LLLSRAIAHVESANFAEAYCVLKIITSLSRFPDFQRKGMAIGHDRFKDEIEILTGRRLKPKKVGRPIGWRKKEGDI
jgi:hypothetical protein